MDWLTLEGTGAAGVDWQAALASDTPLDPYGAWADTLLAPAGALGPTLPALFELGSACDAAGIALLHDLGWTAGHHVMGQGGRFVSAVAGDPGALGRLHAHLARPPATGPRVLRYELGLGYENSDSPAALEPAPPACEEATPPARLSGDLVAFVDHGCAFAHRRLRHPETGATRIAALWNQQLDRLPGAAYPGPRLDWRRPAGFLWGRHVEQPALDAYLRRCGPLETGEHEAACYAGAGYDAVRQQVTHGTHVMDIATGGAQRAGDAHDIVFVQLPRRVDGRPVAGLLRCHVFDALQYIEARLADGRSAVVNVSYGGYAGPHDGTAVIDRAIDEVVERARRRGSTLHVVVPSGNALDRALHARLSVGPGGAEVLAWQNRPDDPTDSFVELWLPPDADVEVRVTAPGGAASAPLAAGGAQVLRGPGGALALAAVPRRAAQSGAGTLLLLAVGPTVRRGRRAPAPYGTWQLSVHNKGRAALALDAWCERDDPVFGTEDGPRQACFVSHVSMRPTLNSLAHARSALVVGGYLRHPQVPPTLPAPLSAGPVASYSSTGAARNGSPGPTLPHRLAPSERSFDQPGLAGAAVLGHGTARLSGTSVAAAWATRCIVANGFAVPPGDPAPGSPRPAHNGVEHPDAEVRIARLG